LPHYFKDNQSSVPQGGRERCTTARKPRPVQGMHVIDKTLLFDDLSIGHGNLVCQGERGGMNLPLTMITEIDRRGQHSIRINEQWRVYFVWQDGNANDVEIVDYR
jgi:hypothetical protein